MREVTPDELGGASKAAVVIGPFGSNLKTTDFTDSGVPLIFVRDIRAGDFSEPRAFVSAEKARQLRAHVALPGDLVVTKMGDPPGDVAIYDGTGSAVITADCIRLRPTGDYDARYLLHAFKTPRVRQQVLDITSGAAQKKVSLERFRHRVTVPVPPLPEQRRIAAILDHADALCAKRRQVLTHLDALAQSLYEHLIGGSKWPRVRLSEITSKVGSGATPRGGQAAYKSDGVALIRSMNVHDGQFVWKDLAFLDDQQAAGLNITGASVARVGRAPASVLPARVTQHVAIIRPTPGSIHSRVLERHLISPHTKRELLNVAGGGATREAITKAQILDLEVPMPDLSAQKRYLCAAARLDELQGRSRDALDAGHSFFLSLQSRAFRGEL